MLVVSVPSASGNEADEITDAFLFESISFFFLFIQEEYVRTHETFIHFL